MSGALGALSEREPSAKYIVEGEPALAGGFDLLATALGGVAGLRQAIFSLTVRGKLVPQSSEDEPAGNLLKRTTESAVNLHATTAARRFRKTAPIDASDLPFDLPRGWAWARIPQVTHDWGQKTPAGQITYIDVAGVDNARCCIVEPVQILNAGDAPSRARKVVKRGTVIYSTVRPYLKNIAIVEKDYEPEPIVSTAFAVMHPIDGVSAEFLVCYLRCNTFTKFVASKMVGVAYPAINDSNFFEGVIPLPPAAEQLRIVARVEELMKLCDALEQSGRLADEQHARLTSTLFDALAASESAHALAENWQRIAAHFDLLLDRPEAIAALEQTILQLAVRGLLVPSDSQPSDWEETTTGAVLNFLNGYAFKSDWFRTKGVRLVRNVNVAHGTLSWANGACVDEAVAQDMERFALHAGDLVISLDRPIISTGLKYAVVRKCDLPCLLLQRVARMTPRAEVLDSAYLELWLQSPAFTGSIDPGRSNGVPHISTRQLEAISLLLPPLVEQHRIVARVEELRRLCAQLRERLTEARRTQSQLADALVAEVG